PSAKTSQSPPKHAIHGAPFGAASKPITIGAPTTPTTAPPTFKRNDQRRSTAAALPSFGAGTGRFTAAHTRAWAPRRRKPRLARREVPPGERPRCFHGRTVGALVASGPTPRQASR